MSLPSGYKRLEYIQSTGTQYINTGFKPNQDTRTIMDFELLSVVGQYADPIFGVRTSSSSKAYYLWSSGYNTTNERYQSGYNNGSTYPSIARVGRHIVDKNKNITAIDGVTTTSTYAVFSTDWNMLLFNSYNNGKLYGKTTKMRLYSCQIYDNGILIRDYIPCQATDGKIGLWDDVNSVFYGNAGTGTFKAGPIVVSPSEITKLKYIQSSGTQYIDTGFKPTGATKIVCDFQMVNQGTEQQGVFGSRPGASGRFTVFTGDSIGALQVDYNTYGTLAKETSTISGLNLNNRNMIEVSNSLVINGTTVKTVPAASFASTYNLFLFANNNVGTAQLPCSMKLYSCRIYDNGTLVRDFIPAKLTDGTVGLYDKLNGLLYINAGTGTFEAGPSSLNLPVNIGGTWKEANEAFVNIGGTWKAVEAAFVNIDGTWKELG